MEEGNFELFFISEIKEIKGRLKKIAEESVYYEGQLYAYENALEVFKKRKEGEKIK